MNDGSKAPKITKMEVITSDEEEESKIIQAMSLLDDIPSKITTKEELDLIYNAEEQEKSKISEATPLLDNVSILMLQT